MNNNNVLNESNSYLDIAYSSREQRNVTLWANNQYGSLVDLNNENILRFVHYDEQHDSGGKKAITSTPPSSQNESEYPIVAAGIVVYWLKERKGSRGVNEIFDDYYNLCLNYYIAKEKKSFDAVGYDLKKEFAQSKHRDRECLLMDYSKKLYPYLNKDDIKQIKQLYKSYYKFVREKLRILYPPKYTSGHEKEEAFLRTYRGAAQFCLNWVCHEHNLPATLEQRNSFVGTLKKNQKENMRKIRWEMNNYEESRFYEDLVSVNSKLMQEINTNLGLCQNQEARVRYVIQMLSSFKDFAQPFCPLNNNKELTETAIQYLQERARTLLKLCLEAASDFHKDVPSVEYCLFVYWADMQLFYNKLAALLLSYKINLMDIQKMCGIYLTDKVIISDYVDKKYIPNEGYARQLLDEIKAKNSPNINELHNENCNVYNEPVTNIFSFEAATEMETAKSAETETIKNKNSGIPSGAEAEEDYIIFKYDHFVEAVKTYKFSECPAVACLNEKQRGQLVRKIVNRHDNYGAYAIAMLCELNYDKWMMDNFAKDYPTSNRGLTKTAIFRHWKDALSLTNQRAIAGNYNVIRNPNGTEDKTIYKASEYTIVVHEDYMAIKNNP